MISFCEAACAALALPPPLDVPPVESSFLPTTSQTTSAAASATARIAPILSCMRRFERPLPVCSATPIDDSRRSAAFLRTRPRRYGPGGPPPAELSAHTTHAETVQLAATFPSSPALAVQPVALANDVPPAKAVPPPVVIGALWNTYTSLLFVSAPPPSTRSPLAHEAV